MVAQARAVLLAETVRKSGPDAVISRTLELWRKGPVHDPGKILLDAALAVALAGHCPADVGMLRAEPAEFGPVASDPTVSRLIDVLAGGRRDSVVGDLLSEVPSAPSCLAVGQAFGEGAGGEMIVDLDGVLVIVQADKQDATATRKKTFGQHPLMGFVKHSRGSSGEPMAGLLIPRNPALTRRILGLPPARKSDHDVETALREADRLP